MDNLLIMGNHQIYVSYTVHVHQKNDVEQQTGKVYGKYAGVIENHVMPNKD